MSTEVGSGNRIVGTNAIGAGASATGSGDGDGEPPQPPTKAGFRRKWAVVVAVILFLAALFGALNDGWQVLDRATSVGDVEDGAPVIPSEEENPDDGAAEVPSGARSSARSSEGNPASAPDEQGALDDTMADEAGAPPGNVTAPDPVSP